MVLGCPKINRVSKRDRDLFCALRCLSCHSTHCYFIPLNFISKCFKLEEHLFRNREKRTKNREEKFAENASQKVEKARNNSDYEGHHRLWIHQEPIFVFFWRKDRKTSCIFLCTFFKKSVKSKIRIRVVVPSVHNQTVYELMNQGRVLLSTFERTRVNY